jgi:hypothetical protein
MKVKYKNRIELRSAPHKKSICETSMVYEIFFDGKVFDVLYFNTRGYVGYLPMPCGSKMNIGEKSLSAYVKEIRLLNKEFKSLAQVQS